MRNTICQADLRFLVLIATIATPLVVPPEASATAQFSRQYNTSCNTCHTAFPKLNDIGIAFKDAWFQFPDEDVSFIATPRTLLSMLIIVPRSSETSFHEYAAPPSSISDPASRTLQQRYFKEITESSMVAAALRAGGAPTHAPWHWSSTTNSESVIYLAIWDKKKLGTSS